MKVFITGTDTDIGKTLISSWICLHTGYSYFKPIQTGNTFDIDTSTVTQLTNVKAHPETYSFSQPLSPHLAAQLDNDCIDIERIRLPDGNVIVEGAGGLLVPLNGNHMMIDLIKFLGIPVILVSKSKLGTINHTLLSLEALRARKLKVLGVILNGEYNADNEEAIEYFGKTKVLACFPELQEVSKENLLKIRLTNELISIFQQ